MKKTTSFLLLIMLSTFEIFSSGNEEEALMLEPQGRYLYQAGRETKESNNSRGKESLSNNKKRSESKQSGSTRGSKDSGPKTDHILNAVGLADDRLLVVSSTALALVDLSTMDTEGSKDYISRNFRIGGRDAVVYQDRYIYTNQHQSEKRESTQGFGIAIIEDNEIKNLGSVTEKDTFYEKMKIYGSYLYVAAHDKGVRIYSLENPEAPIMIGSIEDGFVDAFDVALSGTTLYVADGAGGLKIVDISDKSNPKIVAGETINSAVGTSQSVEVLNGRVYIGAGSAGVTSYLENSIESRNIFELNGTSEELTIVGDYIAVSTFSGVTILKPDEGTSLKLVGTEKIVRLGTKGTTIRTSFGVEAIDSNTIAVSTWTSTDIYKLVPRAESTVTDINASSQRLRFSPNGETLIVTLENHGESDLVIDKVELKEGDFSTDLHPQKLEPGEVIDFTITYTKGSEDQNRVLLIYSNDPDEPVIPIQLFGNTSSLDPGETVPDFTLPVLDNSGDEFTLSNYRGKVIWLQIFGTWCPACTPAVVDMQNSIIKEFENNPMVETWVIDQADKEIENKEWVETWESHFYLRKSMLFDDNGSVAGDLLSQPDVGNMPFGRGFIIDQDGKVVKAFFGHQPQMVIDTINSLIE